MNEKSQGQSNEMIGRNTKLEEINAFIKRNW